MELTEYSSAIKNELALELAKNGHTLEDFENGLASLNTGEGVLKVATIEAGLLPGVLSGVQQAPGLIFKTFAAGGALGGLAADEMDSSVDELNKSLDREREKIKLVKRITENLKREHGL
jgi:hypothetical protein